MTGEFSSTLKMKGNISSISVIQVLNSRDITK